ncbi:claudin domain-containing protein 2 isoform X1 [Peromyscus maniculatus bairdii]|uniref:claudin domain-containing protein 2 isoform X1 n=1 Tax=Peromyscus maniculatus bairdii TaxID=230844 RepID=UPI001C2E4340|nr:claudin domain-containing protein 2 isoform X1 [Peromyscus maniculatus bairdii]
MGVKRSLQTGGNLLNLLTSILTILSTATNYWIRQQGGHSGLWQECSHGICSNIPCQNTLAVTAACMVLAATFSIISLGLGMRIRCQEGESLRSQNAIVLLFLSGGRGPGLLLLIALAGYTAKNAWKPEVFFSWSYFFGWLALPFSFLAGNQPKGRRVETTPLDDSPPQKLPSHLFSQESPQ